MVQSKCATGPGPKKNEGHMCLTIGLASGPPSPPVVPSRRLAHNGSPQGTVTLDGLARWDPWDERMQCTLWRSKHAFARPAYQALLSNH
jgi:hypothetical protein